MEHFFFNRQSQQHNPIKFTCFLPGRENSVQQRAFKLNRALATVKTWDLRRHVRIDTKDYYLVYGEKKLKIS